MKSPEDAYCHAALALNQGQSYYEVNYDNSCGLSCKGVMSWRANCRFQCTSVFRSDTMKCVIVLLATFALTVYGINVETKLDFQGDHAKPPKALEKVRITQRQADGNKGTELVCNEQGCNKTSTESPENIAADIVVQVKTNVDLREKKNVTKVDDVPDVPVVLGYGGTNQQDYPKTDSSYRNNFVPSFGLPTQPPLVVTEEKDYRRVYNGIPQYEPFDPLHKSFYESNWNFDRKGNTNGFYQPKYVPKPPHWYSPRNYPRPTTSAPWTTCICHPVSTWQQPTPSYQSRQNAAHISDKLAPLN